VGVQYQDPLTAPTKDAIERELVSLMVTGDPDDSPWQDPPERPDSPRIIAWARAELDKIEANMPDHPPVGSPDPAYCGYRWTDRTPLKIRWLCNREPEHTDDHEALRKDGTVAARRAQRRKGSPAPE